MMKNETYYYFLTFTLNPLLNLQMMMRPKIHNSCYQLLKTVNSKKTPLCLKAKSDKKQRKMKRKSQKPTHVKNKFIKNNTIHER